MNEIKEVYQDNPPDVYEINNNLNKYRSANDQRLLNYVDGVKNNDPKTLKAIDDYSDKLHYDSVRGQFKKGNKVGALSDFKNDEKLFEPILDRLKVKGKRTQTPIQKKSVAREILKSFKPIELGNDYYKNFQEIKEIQRQSKVSEQRFNEAMKKQNDPDESGGIAYLLGLNQKGEL